MRPLSLNEKVECESLERWAAAKGFDIDELAAVMDESYSTIYRMFKQQRPVNDAFKWRFAKAFGWDEAQNVFESQSLHESYPIPS